MRSVLALVFVGGLVAVGCTQPPPSPDGGGRDTQAADPAAQADKLLAQFDADKDGKITRAELTDDRLKALFDRADADKDGVVTKAELVALFTKEAQAGSGRGGPGGPGGPGGGRGGPGGPGGMLQLGQVLPTFLQDQLGLTADQKKNLADLQKEVDAKLAAILTPEQRKQFDEMKTRGPGGGRGGPGGPGGRPGGLPGPPPDGPSSDE